MQSVMTHTLLKFMMVMAALAAPLALQAGRFKPLQEPNIQVEVDVTAEQLENVIKRALVGRGWEVVSVENGVVNARLVLRTHIAEIRIPYNTETIDLEYVASQNLRYVKRKSGKETIHRNYNSWVNNIKQDILVALSVYR